MTDYEATIIANILISADGECKHCARDLMRKFADNFKEQRSMIEILFRQRFGEELYED